MQVGRIDASRLQDANHGHWTYEPERQCPNVGHEAQNFLRDMAENRENAA
jgi:hypothetical protein